MNLIKLDSVHICIQLSTPLDPTDRYKEHAISILHELSDIDVCGGVSHIHRGDSGNIHHAVPLGRMPNLRYWAVGDLGIEVQQLSGKLAGIVLTTSFNVIFNRRHCAKADTLAIMECMSLLK